MEVAVVVGLVSTALHLLWIVAVPGGWEAWVVERHATIKRVEPPLERPQPFVVAQMRDGLWTENLETGHNEANLCVNREISAAAKSWRLLF